MTLGIAGDGGFGAAGALAPASHHELAVVIPDHGTGHADNVFRRLLAQAIGLIQEVDPMTDKATGDPKKPAVYSITEEKV